MVEGYKLGSVSYSSTSDYNHLNQSNINNFIGTVVDIGFLLCIGGWQLKKASEYFWLAISYVIINAAIIFLNLVVRLAKRQSIKQYFISNFWRLFTLAQGPLLILKLSDEIQAEWIIILAPTYALLVLESLLLVSAFL